MRKKGCVSSLFNVQNTPRIQPFLLILVIAMCLLELQAPIRIGIRVRDPDVKQC